MICIVYLYCICICICIVFVFVLWSLSFLIAFSSGQNLKEVSVLAFQRTPTEECHIIGLLLISPAKRLLFNLRSWECWRGPQSRPWSWLLLLGLGSEEALLCEATVRCVGGRVHRKLHKSKAPFKDFHSHVRENHLFSQRSPLSFLLLVHIIYYRCLGKYKSFVQTMLSFVNLNKKELWAALFKACLVYSLLLCSYRM